MTVRVHVPTHLQDYTGGRARVTASGATVREVLRDLDRAHPGILFRIVDEQGRLRRHVRLYVGAREAASLGARLDGAAELRIVAALSGG